MPRFAKWTPVIAGAALLLAPATAGAQAPYQKPDDSWISITGNVALSSGDSFTLDYGDGLIVVEMDDWDWYNEASRIMPGETVTVYGKIDDDLYELRTIEADTVYAYDRQSYYFANPADEESAYYITAVPVTITEDTRISVSGTVKDVSGREFTLDTGSGEISVDTVSMTYNPLDDIGLQQIDRGDKVYVSGTIDTSFFDERELSADSILSVTQDNS